MGVDAVVWVEAESQPSKEQIKRWSWELGNVFGCHRISNGDEYDAIEIDADYPSRNMLRIDVGTSYYSEIYRRGDFTLIFGVLAWAIQTFDQCKVFYGGDGGSLGEEMTNERIYELFHYYLEHGHIEYDSCFFRPYKTEPPICARCSGGNFKPSMYQSGIGPEWELWRCAGCGKEVERGERAYKTGHKHD